MALPLRPRDPRADLPRAPVPRVLLTNDDGWRSPGLAALAGVLREFAELLIVAPHEETSAIGHAITLREPLEAERVPFEGAAAAWSVKGTPADCAKLAVRSLFADDPPRLCVSGLNRGPNVGVNVFYSGTVAAALESAVNGVPGVAVSQELGSALSPREAACLVRPLLEEVLGRGLPPWHVINVNVPDAPAAEVRGIRLTRHGVSGFSEWYRELAAPSGDAVRRFQVEGEMRLRECDGTTDAEALAEGWISVTPMALDLTAGSPAVAQTDGPEAQADRWDWLAGVPLGRV